MLEFYVQSYWQPSTLSLQVVSVFKTDTQSATQEIPNKCLTTLVISELHAKYTHVKTVGP